MKKIVLGLAVITLLAAIGIGAYMWGFILGEDKGWHIADAACKEKMAETNKNAKSCLRFQPRSLSLDPGLKTKTEILKASPNYVDVLGGVRLRYPAGYSLVKSTSGSLFFVNKGSRYIDEVKNVVKCQKDMYEGKTELGLCWEGSVLGDVDVEVEMMDQMRVHEGCDKQENTDGIRALYSCLKPGFGGEPVHYYYLYLRKSEGYWYMKMETLEPWSNSDLLDALVVSASG